MVVIMLMMYGVFFFSSRRRHTRCSRDWTSDVCSSDLYSTNGHLTQRQIRRLFESDPRLIVGTNVLWFGLIILFLYVTLSVLPRLPFWRSLGWKRLDANTLAGKGRPWMYFLSGSGLSLFVIGASSRVKNAEHVPIQEMFKSRSGAMLLMTMAVLVAPLVEETV